LWDKIKKALLFDAFPLLCRLTGSALLLLALYGLGFPPKDNIGSSQIVLFILGTFFLLVPVAKKISLGKWLSFESELEKVREDVSDFKSETRQYLSVYSNMVNAISNTVNQTVNVHLPGPAEAEEAKDDLRSTLGEEPLNTLNQADEYLSLSGNDINYALAKLRMDLERRLREILGKRITTSAPQDMKGQFLSARSLFKQLAKEIPKYKGMQTSFDYVLKVCNAAIHGQTIFDGHGLEAINIGLRILSELEHTNLTE